MNDDNILDRITALVDREHTLRGHRADGSLDERTEHHELHAVEAELDQCWDLLRQRRAKRDFGGDPDEAVPRSASVVESYWQ
ncbi:DUF2630 family protein [Streptosporangium sp. 'caverna']|uniref:DUF2630 family protein n=1 Tax=Streptosporangium sp. 'caverna' TaxID=2202249 RepID=UPI000D7D38E9|nr:DUF2630 family protein [Streptosporangium sp. 'caverna']AWS45626.1 DUF2630 domain-containing protein [Streptosporangium sp. 'caverna']